MKTYLALFLLSVSACFGQPLYSVGQFNTLTETSSSSSVYTFTMNPTLTGYPSGAGQLPHWTWKVGTGCVGSGITGNVNGLGSASIVNPDGTNPTTTQCAAGQKLMLTYDSVAGKFVILGGAAGNIILGNGVIYPLANGTAAIKVTLADGVTGLMTFDTTNKVVDIAGVGIFGAATERVSLLSGSFAFNRNVSNGAIYDTNGYAYQWQHTKSVTAASDAVCIQVYNPAATQLTTQILCETGNLRVGVLTNAPISDFDVNGTSAAKLFQGRDAAPAASSCGTSPIVVAGSSTTGGTVTEGSASTGCVLTFANAPSRCTPTSQSGLSFSYSLSGAVLTITNIGALSSTNIDWTCTK